MKSSRLRNSVPTANLRTVLEILRDRGFAAERVMKGSGLTLAQLDDTEWRVPAAAAAQLVRNAYLLSGDPGLGLEFGLRSKPTAHGPLGYAAMACGTLREALELIARYMHLRQQDVSLRLTVESAQVVLQGRDTHDIGPARRFIYEGMFIAVWHIAGFLLGEDQPECELWFDWPQPKYYAAYRQRLPKVRYGMPSVQMRMHERYLKRRLVMAEPEAVKRAVAECEREMLLMGGAPRPQAGDIRERVRALLGTHNEGYPCLETVAARLYLSGRTLKRRLEQQDSSFQALLDEVRYRDAQKLLENPELDIAQIAAALGYTDPPSFTRAFRRWSGRTPSKARATKKA